MVTLQTKELHSSKRLVPNFHTTETNTIGLTQNRKMTIYVVIWTWRGVYRVLVGKPEGRRPLGRPRRRWADNIRTDLQEVACVYMDWIGLAQDRDRWRTLVSAVMNLGVP